MAPVKLIEVSSCREGGGTFVEHGGKEFAVFLQADGDVFVTDNACPHASGNLSGGEVKGGVVSCPWHHWEFDLESGVCTHSDQARVCTYAARVRDGMVEIELKD